METQKSVTQWAEKTFGPAPDHGALVDRACLELQELRSALKAEDVEEIGSELADIIILLYRIAELRGLDITEQIDSKMQVNRQRAWIAKGDGTGRHV